MKFKCVGVFFFFFSYAATVASALDKAVLDAAGTTNVDDVGAFLSNGEADKMLRTYPDLIGALGIDCFGLSLEQAMVPLDKVGVVVKLLFSLSFSLFLWLFFGSSLQQLLWRSFHRRYDFRKCAFVMCQQIASLIICMYVLD